MVYNLIINIFYLKINIQMYDFIVFFFGVQLRLCGNHFAVHFAMRSIISVCVNVL